MAAYWLGAPGVSYLEYPPGSGQLYPVGSLIPGMSDEEARAMLPLGHSFEIPDVFPYGTPYREPAAFTQRRVGPAVRTGEPETGVPGVIIGGAAPQALWAPQQDEDIAAQVPVVPVEPGVIVGGAAPQGAWSSGAGVTRIEAATGAWSEPAEVVAVAVPDPNYEPPTDGGVLVGAGNDVQLPDGAQVLDGDRAVEAQLAQEAQEAANRLEPPAAEAEPPPAEAESPPPAAESAAD